jgi:hypothetical protein
MTKSANDILISIQKLITRWVAANRDLTADMTIGSDTISVKSNFRFDVGEQVVVSSLFPGPDGDVRKGEFFVIKELPDFETMVFEETSVAGHLSSKDAFVTKTIGKQWPKRIYIGDKAVIPDYPAITVSIDNSSIDWLTLDSTTDTFNLTIMVYVLDDNSEDGYQLAIEYAELIREALMRNLHPVIDSGVGVISTDLSSAGSVGDTIITVDDTDGFLPDNYIVLRDLANVDQLIIKRTVSATEIEVKTGLAFDFPLSRLPEVIRPLHYIYDSRPETTTYGVTQKGSAFLKAASISWWCKEERIRQVFVEPKV